VLVPDQPGPRLGACRLNQPPIENYALIGDCRSAALVGRDGAVDWLCWPRFDSPACFAALLGSADNGRWRIGPAEPGYRTTRRYRPDTMILETSFDAAGGSAALIDFMVPSASAPSLVRIVEGRAGRIALDMELAPRFGYGAVIPQIEARDGGAMISAGAERAVLRTAVPLRHSGATIRATFVLHAGERVVFVLSHGAETAPDAETALAATEAFWRDWHARGRYPKPWHDAVARSALVLKALTFAPTGAMVAAPTTSLPELPGGTRNWDYRFCWLRDSALAARALLRAGHLHEAAAWRDWLVRSLAGDPAHMRILYGLGGEREPPEQEAAWLSGYRRSRPVRIGNAAVGQLQVDVFGELMHTLYRCAQAGLAITPAVWTLQQALLAHLEAIWTEPDEGIWEVRDGRRHFTFSKVMAWVAFDRAVRTAEEFGLAGPVAHWRAMRELIHATVCRDGFDPARGCFVRSFGATVLDASLLQIPLVGFLPPDDPRVVATVAAIERDLTEDGLVLRYRAADGLPPGEGVFLACSFWLAEIMAQQGRAAEAAALFARLLGLANDVGLLAEEYDPRARRLRGNFPQAFSHLALIDTAIGLATGSA
jgi:GH15 family glucan-1,4-alpha-glucosidase